MANYAVCTECDFLRVLAAEARGLSLPHECPQCGSELVVIEHESRFAPAYIGRVSRSLHNTDPLASPERHA